MTLMDWHRYLEQSPGDSYADAKNVLELAISCLDLATNYTPCDGRVYNNLGIALERLLEGFLSEHSIKSIQLHERISSAYQTAVMIHSSCDEVGCDVASDYAGACLNYGLYLSKLDKFDAAIEILELVPDATVDENELDAAAWARQRVTRDATNLLLFCRRMRSRS